MNEELNKINWDVILQGDIQGNWETFTEYIHQTQNKTIPKFKVKATGPRNPFVDRQAIDAIKEKRRKWGKYLHCKNHITL